MNKLDLVKKDLQNFVLKTNELKAIKGGGWGNGGSSNGNGCPPPHASVM
ncbi:MAG: hypothetical protein NXI23_07960 [Bacteroidetes bacterium]|jgi:hypothetical protein|nr:hypothetical protein [Bacteroidota bacterium]MDF1864845.1 hypothetical protein [Saprospiraceae bacterium]